MNTDFQIIQIGNVLLKGVNQTNYGRNFKTNRSENQYSDGTNDNTIFNYRSDLEVEFTCQFDEKNYDDKIRMEVVLEQKEFVCFFVRFEKYDGKVLKTNVVSDNFGEYVPTFYFGYGFCKNNIKNDYSNSNNLFTEIEATIELHPNLYRADEYLSFIPKENEVLIPNTFWGGGAVWGGGIIWGQFYNLLSTLAKLTPDGLKELIKCSDCGCTELQNYLIVEDIYIKPKFDIVSSWKLKTKSIGAKLEPYTSILVTNSTQNQIVETIHPVWGIRPQKTVIVEITRQNAGGTILANALSQGDVVEIINIHNSSGFKLKWKSSILSPQFLQVRYDTNTLFDVSTNLVEIDSSLYSLETLGNNNEGLYFNAGQISNPILQPNAYQTLSIKTNFATLSTNKVELKVTNYISTY